MTFQGYRERVKRAFAEWMNSCAKKSSEILKLALES